VGTSAAASVEAKRRGRVRAANEERILRAAEAVFAEQGFSGATTAAIAERAGVPKANLHYYFASKEALYGEVLRRILDLWLRASDAIAEDADPATALGSYIAEKLRYSRTRPLASKIFASELLHGAPRIADFLAGDLRRAVDRKAEVIERWIAEGRLAPVEPRHLLFLIWAATQTYADFDIQVAAVLGRRKLTQADFTRAAETISSIVLRGLVPVGRRDDAPPAIART
jgi:TetR/AcrR family transcriptional regulator